MVTVGEESYAGEDAATLFARYFGPDRKLPIVQMRYWLVGAPAPDLPHEETLGADRRLATLSQSGWQVRYDRYQPVGDARAAGAHGNDDSGPAPARRRLGLAAARRERLRAGPRRPSSTCSCT